MRFVVKSVLILILMFFSLSLFPDSVRRTTFNVGFWKNLFTNIGEREFSIGTAVLGKQFLKSVPEKKVSTMKTIVYPNVSAIIRDVGEGTVDLLVVPVFIYFEIEEMNIVDFIAYGSYSGTFGGEYILLVNKAGGETKLEDLKERQVVIENELNSDVALAWVETTLSERRLPSSAKFFKEVSFVDKPIAALMPVLLGQKEACIVNRRSYEVMKELNSQIAANLRAIMVSPDFIQGILTIRRSIPEEDKRLIGNAIDSFNNYERSREMLNLFGWDRIEKRGKRTLEKSRKLYESYKNLQRAGK